MGLWLLFLMGVTAAHGMGMDALQRVRKLLAEVEASAKELFEAGRLDAVAARGLADALAGAERKLAKETSSEGQELYFMARILRGTIYQKAFGLDDAAVETRDAYTLSNARFWQDYYNSTELRAFDWYGSWDTDVAWRAEDAVANLGTVLQRHLHQPDSILMLGCGRSDLSEQMYGAGFRNITNVDISTSLLSRLESYLGPSMPEMSWRWMNASAMSADSASFDTVVEKGTFDSIQENAGLLQAAVAETHRVLREGGVLISITDAPRARRLDQLGHVCWRDCLSHDGRIPTMSGDKELFVHVCTKCVAAGRWSELARRWLPASLTAKWEL